MNPPLLYSILLAASTNLLLRGVCNSSIQATVYRGRTIRLINEALRDKEHAVEDSTFAAVIHLAHHEVSILASSYSKLLLYRWLKCVWVLDDERRSGELGASYEGSRNDDQDQGWPSEFGVRWSDTSYDILV
jgi:hypothetical protein